MSELDGVPEGAPTEWLKPDGTIIPESAPENVRNLVAAKKWDNVSQLAEGYGELEKLQLPPLCLVLLKGLRSIGVQEK